MSEPLCRYFFIHFFSLLKWHIAIAIASEEEEAPRRRRIKETGCCRRSEEEEAPRRRRIKETGCCRRSEEEEAPRRRRIKEGTSEGAKRCPLPFFRSTPI